MKTVVQDLDQSFIEFKDRNFYFFIDKNFTAFKGHFPSYPILPGIVQIQMALLCIKKLLNTNDVVLKEIRKIKFIKPILPKTKVIVTLSQDQNKFSATIKNGTEEEIFSQLWLTIY
jgi:3-hydroxymyristoyl/3-hydroxydecanoyl-(acyl carrier protein) dehydratase